MIYSIYFLTNRTNSFDRPTRFFFRERERESIDSNLGVNIVYNQLSRGTATETLSKASLKITSLLKGRAEEWSRVATSFETFD